MTIHERAIAKIRQLPEPLAQEVSDFVDFLLIRNDDSQWEHWTQFMESQQIAEVDMSDYLANLQDYEADLANGKIQW